MERILDIFRGRILVRLTWRQAGKSSCSSPHPHRWYSARARYQMPGRRCSQPQQACECKTDFVSFSRTALLFGAICLVALSTIGCGSEFSNVLLHGTADVRLAGLKLPPELPPEAAAYIKKTCTLLNPDGRPVSPPDGTSDTCRWRHSVQLPKQQYTLRVSVACGGTQDVVVQPANEEGRPNEFLGELPPPAAQPRYLREALERPVWTTIGDRHTKALGTIPRNTRVSVLAPVSDPNGQCTKALVRVDDAGGAGGSASVFMAPMSVLTDEPMGGLSAADAMAQDRESQARLRAEAKRQHEEETNQGDDAEQGEGRCSEKRHGDLEKLLPRLQMVLGRQGLGLGFVGHYYLLASPEGKEPKPSGRKGASNALPRGALAWTPGLSGKYVLLAVSPSEVALKVVGPDGYTVGTRGGTSSSLAVSQGAPHADDVVFSSNAGDVATLRAIGRGCTLVLIFRE